MKTITNGPVSVFFEPADENSGVLVAGACKRSIGLAAELWGLPPPRLCRVFVMTSWTRFVFQAAPLLWRILLAASFPLWCSRVRRTWRLSAGWTLRFGARTAIGVKPPRLIEKADKSIGKMVAIEEMDQEAKVRQVTCHEIIHACTSSLSPPSWLDEGMAMYAVDRFMGKPTVKPETLALVRDSFPKTAPVVGRTLYSLQPESIACHYARAYWLVRYLEEARPGLLRDAFLRPKKGLDWEREIADRLGIVHEDFWSALDGVIVSHFPGCGESQGCRAGEIRRRPSLRERFHDLFTRVGLWGGIAMLLGGGVWLIAGLSIGYLFTHAVILFVLGLVFSAAGIVDHIALARRVRSADESLAGRKREEVKARCPRCERVFIARFGDGLSITRCPGCRKTFRRSQITVAD